jgi:hypothetical protein
MSKMIARCDERIPRYDPNAMSVDLRGGALPGRAIRCFDAHRKASRGPEASRERQHIQTAEKLLI